MKKLTTFFLGLTFCFAINAQDEASKFTVEISTDSILMGNYFEVKFTLENISGDNFSPPEFDGFRIVGGPNQATSMSFINGEMTRSMSYSYYLEPKDIGSYWIQAASVETSEEILETVPLEVMVVPNPEGIKQYPQQREQRRLFFDDFFERPSPQLQPLPNPAPKKETTPQPKKKKRKTVKI